MKRGSPFRTSGLASLALAAFTLLVAPPARSQCTRPSDCLPPPGGCAYSAPNTVFYPGAPVNGIRKITLLDFSRCDPPPPGGGTLNSFFDVFVELELTQNGGVSWSPRFCGAHVIWRLQHPLPDPAPGVRHIDIEILSMQLVGGNLPVNFTIRESPTQPSAGPTTIQQVGGNFVIDSFFDVFTELSLDNGQTWRPGDTAAHFSLQPLSPTPVLGPTWGALKTIYR
jgi:hypothetical protein